MRVYRLRVRDAHAAELTRQANAVNFVWNYCNETQQKAAKAGRKWLSAYDLISLTSGSSKDLDIHAHTIQAVCFQYERSRAQRKKPWLRWRGRKSLGWVPFNTGCVSFDGECFIFRRRRYRTLHMREVPKDIGLKGGNFSQNSRGHWFINIPIEDTPIANEQHKGPAVGIDLGLKDLATLSTGEKIKTPRFARVSEAKLAAAQRAKRTKRTRNIHMKIANRRKDYLHKASNRITKEFGLIIVGDVSSKKLARSRLAKSIADAGWANFKSMLSYKAIARGGVFLKVSEAYTTQMCSECGAMPPSRPKGIAHLGIREWTCDACGAIHDRDVNAARNILRAGQCALVGGAHV